MYPRKEVFVMSAKTKGSSGTVVKSSQKDGASTTSKPPKKDPDAPIKPPSTFFIYLKEKQHSVRRELEAAEGKGIPNNEVAKVCAERWKELDNKAKKKYVDQQKQCQVRYMEEMKIYNEKNKEKRKKTEKAVKTAVDKVENIAKHAVNKDARTDIPQMYKDYFKFLESSWPRVSLAMPELGPAELQDTLWRIWSGEDGSGQQQQDNNQNLVISSIKRKLFIDTEPEQPKSAFQFFVDGITREIENANQGSEENLSKAQVTHLCEERWEAMTEIEKKAFVVAELKDLERYKMEMRGWAEAGGKNAFGKRRIEQTQSVAKRTKTVLKEETPMVVLKEEVMKQEEAGAGEWESGLLYDTQEECEEEAEDTAEPRDESPQLRIVPDQDQLHCHERFTSSDEESEYYSPNE